MLQSAAFAEGVPILLYHRFGPVKADSMTVTTPVFESQMKYLKDNGYTIIPLRQLIDNVAGKGVEIPQKAVVIVADDAHKTVYTDMLPIAKKYNLPVTLFVYPSAVSNARYAMTWKQLHELKATGLFDIQSHSYWHPNFNKDKKRIKKDEYERFVDVQLVKSNAKLEKEFGGKVDLIAWPFGIYDDFLIGRAKAAGYIAAFSIERRHITKAESIMRLPRYIITNADRGKIFERILKGNAS
jgi:peptidoglycan/xylan/chitin deacetylase (PgdA/CDA1 family)